MNAATETISTDSVEPIAKVRNLYRYFGNLKAVDDVSFDILPGQVVGFIGANGSGKTTTMRIMATLDTATSGTVEICGKNTLYYPNEVRHHIGWMPDSYGTYGNVTVFDYLDFFARSYGLKGKERRARVAEVMDFADLTQLADRMMNTLSKGMGQRLCFGRTLLHDPDILIMDEPAAGLDPKARIELKRLIRLLAEQNKTIFISSHILTELAEMCNYMIFINKGKVVHHGSSDSLMYERGNRLTVDVKVRGDLAKLVDWVKMRPHVTVQEHRTNSVLISAEFEDGQDQETLANLLRAMVGDGVEIIEFHRVQQKLEDAFVNMLKQLEEDAAVAPFGTPAS